MTRLTPSRAVRAAPANSVHRMRSGGISQGRLIIADRHNHRVHILTTDGTYLGEYREFSGVSAMAIAAKRHDLCRRRRVDAAQPS